MEHRYRIVLSNQNFYKEFELPAGVQSLVVGTGVECEARLRKELFFSPVKLRFFKKEDGGWAVSCCDELYFSEEEDNSVSKPMLRDVKHGEAFLVNYRQSDNLAFRVEFTIDFNTGERRYERIIELGQTNTVQIGTDRSCQILLTGPLVQRDKLILTRNRDGFCLEVVNAFYGAYHNGRKIEKAVQLRNMDFFSVADYFFYLRDNQLFTEIRPDINVRELKRTDVPIAGSYPCFNRNTRVQEKLNEEPIEILNPPQKPQKPKNNLITRLLPSMGMLLAAGIMAYLGGMMIIMSAISGAMAVITTIITYRETKKDFREGTEKRISTYNAYIDKKRGEIQEARAEEKKALERIYISPEQERQYFDEFSPSLFDREPNNPDFLCVRLGLGDTEAVRKVEYKKQERLEIEDELQLMPERLHDEYRYIHDAPVVFDLKKANAVGVVGLENCRFALLKNIVMDLVARHYYTDVRFAFISSKEHAGMIRWLRALPYVNDPDSGLRLIVSDDESKAAVFESLYRELATREREKHFDSRLIAFFYDEYGFKSHPVSRFIGKAAELGATFVFFGNTAQDIPLGCNAIIRSYEIGEGELIDASGEEQPRRFRYNEIDDQTAWNTVRLLAPVYTEEISLEGGLTRSISLFQLLHIYAADDLNLQERWNATKVFQSMSAPIGVSKSGVVYLDLHDTAHGPHGLVAGTTGSGKSEILQTYILSMATLFGPSEVGFVIIDFKGGGMANQFKDLPHLLGTITNIDGKEIERSLKSIKAELQTRQKLFAEAGVNHIDRYIQKYRAGEVIVPLPHLIVIVDEFAELKAEQPEFMKELISAARIGRSLGVHLILATQKPAGQVNDQIWSNSRFKLCLKVQSQEDSNEVLKSPLAAEIKEPGRAYLQVGNNEIFELFQSAYSGAPENAFDNSAREYAICSVSDVGKRTVVYSQTNNRDEDNTRTQLQAIIDYVASYCKKNQIAKLPNIFLPPLQPVIDFPNYEEGADIPLATTVDVGVFDDPENQNQDVYALDIENQNVMIIGSAQSGKTNLLQTILRSIAARYTPEQVSVYIIDFASMTLKNFEALRHVGGVVTAAEDEKLRNLLKLLFGEIERRKQRMLEVGVSSFSAYREAGMTDLPHIVVMIDNLTALKETYFQDDTELLRLCREGLSVGITVVVANGQTSGIGYKYLTNFSARIALFCNDSSEYSALYNHCRERVEDVRGRCLIEMDKRFLDCQTYLAFQGEKEYERVEKIRAFIEETNERVSGRALMIPEIPRVLTDDYVAQRYADQMKENYSLVIGLDYGTVSPIALTLSSQGLLAVSGRAHSGKTNFIRYIVTMLERIYPGRSEVLIVDSIGRRLEALKEEPNVKAYSILPDKAIEYIQAVEAALKERYEVLADGNEAAVRESSLLLVVLNSVEAMEAVSGNPAALEAFRNILGRYRNLGACVLLGNYDNAAVTYNSPEVIKKARDARQIIFFEDLSNMKITDVPVLTLRTFKKPIELGDGYFIKENDCLKLKTARITEKTD